MCAEEEVVVCPTCNVNLRLVGGKLKWRCESCNVEIDRFKILKCHVCARPTFDGVLLPNFERAWNQKKSGDHLRLTIQPKILDASPPRYPLFLRLYAEDHIGQNGKNKHKFACTEYQPCALCGSPLRSRELTIKFDGYLTQHTGPPQCYQTGAGGDKYFPGKPYWAKIEEFSVIHRSCYERAEGLCGIAYPRLHWTRNTWLLVRVPVAVTTVTLPLAPAGIVAVR
jgi:hypothetical protein